MRIALAFDPARLAILLLGGNKSGVSQNRFYKQLIAEADALHVGCSTSCVPVSTPGGRDCSRSDSQI
jgi:hypothetical protein